MRCSCPTPTSANRRACRLANRARWDMRSHSKPGAPWKSSEGKPALRHRTPSLIAKEGSHPLTQSLTPKKCHRGQSQAYLLSAKHGKLVSQCAEATCSHAVWHV